MFLMAVSSHPARGAWIEITITAQPILLLTSHPASGAWIEIGYAEVTIKKRHVAPRKGCVD